MIKSGKKTLSSKKTTIIYEKILKKLEEVKFSNNLSYLDEREIKGLASSDSREKEIVESFLKEEFKGEIPQISTTLVALICSNF